ncbi:hypothetical protein DFH09DRAFT_1356877 [Mycena vulgaris]|nr:hypothetical protein DFH09DRAFT_1356877 [Mycena vulgaris]
MPAPRSQFFSSPTHIQIHVPQTRPPLTAWPPCPYSLPPAAALVLLLALLLLLAAVALAARLISSIVWLPRLPFPDESVTATMVDTNTTTATPLLSRGTDTSIARGCAAHTLSPPCYTAAHPFYTLSPARIPYSAPPVNAPPACCAARRRSRPRFVALN